MPRPLRIEYENAWYHVMNRGANRQSIYRSTADRHLFYTILGEITDQFQIEIHAFCLMSNHYHLLVKTPYANLGNAMRYLDGVHTQRYNRISRRDGPLFRGRYKSILVESNEYLLQVSRYIHLNPVAAHVCHQPHQFKWSSYRSYLNDKLSIAWLQTLFILNQMTGDNLQQSYSDFVSQGIDKETELFYNKKQLSSIFGSKQFVEMNLSHIDKSYVPSVLTDVNRTKPLPHSDTILNGVINYFHLSLDELGQSTQGRRNEAKMIAIYLLRYLGQLKHKDISNVFGNIKVSSISSLINRSKRLLKIDLTFQVYVSEITKMILKST